jgi:3-methylcrotonyl-CoA carboxylase alpha subunit
VTDEPGVTRIADGVYRLVVDGRSEIVYVAGPATDQWAFWNGQVFHRTVTEVPTRIERSRADVPQPLTAPMPATVLKVLAVTGASVRKGDTLVILEAMKMELPIRATASGVVTQVSCREGELVQAGALLVELG